MELRCAWPRAVRGHSKLMDVYLTDGNEDLNRHPSELYQKLTALYDKSEADQGPTASAVAVNDSFRHWMDDSPSALRDFDAKDIPEFNALLKSHKLVLAIQP